MISIVVPYYNAKDTLLDVALNAVAQLFPGAELILVDDGSVDQSSTLVPEIDRAAKNKGVLLRHIELSHNSGLLSARIVGARAALFSHVGFLDADDYISNINPGEIEYIVANNFDVALYRFLYCDEKLYVHDELVPPFGLSAKTAFRENLMSWKFTTMGIYNRELYISCPDCFLKGFACAEEVYFKYLFMKVNKIHNSHVKYFYVQNPLSYSKSMSIQRLTKILSYHSLVEIMKEERCCKEDIFLASTCTLNIAVEQSRTISTLNAFDSSSLKYALKKHIVDVFWKRRAWNGCFNFSYPRVSLKNALKLSYLLLVVAGSS